MADSQLPIDDSDSHPVSFEVAMGELERIVLALEDGQLDLDSSLQQYEQGIKHLTHCYRLLDKAERRIRLLQDMDTDGNLVAESFAEEESNSLEEKSKTRAKRRTASPKMPSNQVESDENNVDARRGLF